MAGRDVSRLNGLREALSTFVRVQSVASTFAVVFRMYPSIVRVHVSVLAESTSCIIACAV